MRKSIAVLLGTMALLGSFTVAQAQRERSDRSGGRMDSHDIRDDIEQDRLKKPNIQPSTQQTFDPVAEPKPKRKPKPQN